ncbi:OLC1v1033385C1 [Oldenlandia corymbosa var. corymbosa]|uniref:OLC1v1033385C1 n=1 Tax=Oldenlandia corymbosa var. corymbosa TaxID=529605 RepID=A0AAV1CPX3_OLDCO|nr:OLC1v1033385C1 [Oldenlandia corymbosa var. corymbosa]
MKVLSVLALSLILLQIVSTRPVPASRIFGSSHTDNLMGKSFDLYHQTTEVDVDYVDPHPHPPRSSDDPPPPRRV